MGVTGKGGELPSILFSGKVLFKAQEGSRGLSVLLMEGKRRGDPYPPLLEPQSCPRCWGSPSAHWHPRVQTNKCFPSAPGEENWEGGCVAVLQVQGHVAASGTLKDPTEDASWDNPTWQLPKRQIMTHNHPPPPPHAPGSLPHTFTGSHVTCLVTSVWVKMCLMKPNLERTPQCHETARASPISADR